MTQETQKGKPLEESSLFIISLQTEIQILHRKTNNLSLPIFASESMSITQKTLLYETTNSLYDLLEMCALAITSK